MSPSKHLPEGKLGLPLLVFGAVSFLLAFGADAMGVFSGGESAIRAGLESGGFVFFRDLGLRSLSGAILGLLACFGMVGMILATPGTWRRVMLGVSQLILVAMLLPVFAVWGVFWQPLALMLGVLWAWFSAMFYAERHRMPCEGAVPAKRVTNVIPMTSPQRGKPEQRKKNGDGAR